MPNERPSLEMALASYDRASAREHIALGEQERKEVLDRFPIDRWPTMPLERYALGQETSDDTFCQWMEYRTQHLGSIRGGSARKLIIYKHRDKPGWYFDPEYKDEQEAWLGVRQAFVHAFEKAKAGDWNTIDDLTPLSGGPALRLKTLRVYFPTDVLPIFLEAAPPTLSAGSGSSRGGRPQPGCRAAQSRSARGGTEPVRIRGMVDG